MIPWSCCKPTTEHYDVASKNGDWDRLREDGVVGFSHTAKSDPSRGLQDVLDLRQKPGMKERVLIQVANNMFWVCPFGTVSCYVH